MHFSRIRRAQIPAGTYKARINDIREGINEKNGVEYMTYDLSIYIDGEAIPKNVKIYVFENSPSFFKLQNNVLMNYGSDIDSNGEIDPNNHIGTLVEADISVTVTPDGNEYLVLDSYRPLEADFPPESNDDDDSEILDLILDDY